MPAIRQTPDYRLCNIQRNEIVTYVSRQISFYNTRRFSGKRTVRSVVFANRPNEYVKVYTTYEKNKNRPLRTSQF